MRIEELTELHLITPIANLPSMLTLGILSHKRASGIVHGSIANADVQNRRANVRIPSGRGLHEYANLYFNARNPMMFNRQAQHSEICILRVSTDVMTLPDVVIADRNAARGWSRMEPFPDGLAMIDRDRVYAEWWTHPGDPEEQYRHKGEMCAEVLVPNFVPPDLIMGTYVSCAASAAEAQRLAPGLPITVNGYMFFYRGR